MGLREYKRKLSEKHASAGKANKPSWKLAKQLGGGKQGRKQETRMAKVL